MAHYDVEMNLGDAPGAFGTTKRPYFGIARSTFVNGMSIRVFGHTKECALAMPPVAGEFSVFNDSRMPVIIKRGGEEQDVPPGETGWFEMDGNSQASPMQLIRLATQKR